MTVATRSPLGGMLTTGGVRKRADGEDFGIPVLGGARKNRGTIIRRGRNAPDDVIRKMKGFFQPADDSRNKLLYVRTSKYARGENDRRKKQLMFIMQKEVPIKPWWNLKDILSQAMVKWLPERFVEKCEEAMKTRDESKYK